MDSLPGNYPWRCPLLLSPQILFLSNTYFINYSVHNLFPTYSNRMGAHCKCHLKIEKILPYCETSIITFTDIVQSPEPWQLPATFRGIYTLLLPTTLSPEHPYCVVSVPSYSWSKKGHFSGSDCKIPSFENTQRPFRPLLYYCELTSKYFVFQIFKIHSLWKTNFVFSSCIYTLCSMWTV